MTQTIQIHVRLFGAFRKFHNAPIKLTVPSGTSVSQIKSELGQSLQSLNPAFNDLELLAKSALADDHAVLSPDASLTADTQLAILPPVCGG